MVKTAFDITGRTCAVTIGTVTLTPPVKQGKIEVISFSEYLERLNKSVPV